MTLLRIRVSTHPGKVFFEVLRCQVTRFQLIAGSTLQWLQVYLFEHRQSKRTMSGFGLQRSFGRNILELLLYYLMPNKCKILKI